MQSEGENKVEVPPVPGVWRLGWLLFMQPVTLSEQLDAWLKTETHLLQAYRRNLKVSPLLQRVLVSLTCCSLIALLPIALVYSSSAHIRGTPTQIGAIFFTIAASSRAFMTAALRTARCIGGRTGAVAALVTTGAAYSVIAIVGGASTSFTYRTASTVGLVLGFLGSEAFSQGRPRARSFAFLHAPLWPVEALAMSFVGLWLRLWPHSASRIISWPPFLWHDLSLPSLPGLRSFLTNLADVDVVICKEMIARAANSVGQGRPARLALIELQARDLEHAARDRLFARAADLDFPFLPSESSMAVDKATIPILPFQSAARDLIAGGTNHHQRKLAHQRARRMIEGFRTTTAIDPRPSPLARRLLATAALWLDVIREEEHKLSLEEAASPDVPTAFIAGPALTSDRPENRTLFKGRDNVIKLIEHDLAPDRRGVLLVTGQRRMGKTSLRNYLPTYLGTGTTIVITDFQSLSGDPHREIPHRRILSAISAAVPTAPQPPDSPRWGDALTYLQTLDTTLTHHTLLIVIDEVERLQDGIQAGWASTDFLDFLRAAGDSLRRIRFLLLTAYPLHRLGPHWVDRLISATSRSISYLGEPDARELIVRPIPDFPDIYPEGGVDEILAQTGRHPYLLQKVGDELCRLLNARGGRRRATPEELTEVFDIVVRDVDLFDELWQRRTEDEQAALRRLAASTEPLPPDAASRDLVREGYLDKRDGKVAIAVPLFREWIADTQGTE